MKNIVVKRTLTAFIVLCMLFGLAGCSGSQTGTTDPQPTASIVSQAPEATAEPEATKAPDAAVTPEATKAPEPTPVVVYPTPLPAGTSQKSVDEMTWQEFLEDMGAGWNLGNTLDPKNSGSDDLSYEGSWSQGGKTKPEWIQTIKDAGFKTIRIPVSWHNHVDETKNADGTSTFTIRKVWMDRVHEVVDYAYDLGLYVIINIHHDDYDTYYVYPDEEHYARSSAYVTQIWEQIAREFGDYDEHLIFECLNEVRLTGDAQWNPGAAEAREAQGYINKFNQEAVNVIRATEGAYNATRYIACPGYVSSIDAITEGSYVLPTDPGPRDNRIMVSVHAYVNWDFVSASTKKCTLDIESEITRSFININSKLTKKNIPAYIGEWGVTLGEDNITERSKYAKQYLMKAATSCRDLDGNLVRIPCILWDNSYYGGKMASNEKFGFFDRKNNCFFEEEYKNLIIECTYKEY